MLRTAPVVLLLLVPAAARGDAGSVPGRDVWINYTFTVEQDYPDYDFYVVTNLDAPAVRMPLSPTTPVRVLGEECQIYALEVFAVKKPLRPPPVHSYTREFQDWLRAN